MLTHSSTLISGGTGSCGHTFFPTTPVCFNLQKLVAFFKDEMKRWDMARMYKDDERVRCFIGPVRDTDRLARALKESDFIIYGAATKIVSMAELAAWIERNRQSIGKI